MTESQELIQMMDRLRELRKQRFPDSKKPDRYQENAIRIWNLYVMIPDRLMALVSRLEDEKDGKK